MKYARNKTWLAHMCKNRASEKKHYNALSTMRMLAYAYKNFDNRNITKRVHVIDK